MYQPDKLKSSEDHLPWSRGRGIDVWSMLHASATGDVATVEALLAEDPALATCEFEYRTPLHFALIEDQAEVASLLLQRDAVLYGLENKLEIVRARGHRRILEMVDAYRRERWGYRAEFEPLAAMIRERRVDGVKAALRANPQLLQAADAGGNRAIHWATMTRQIELIDFLIAQGADINAARPDGARPVELCNGDYDYRGWRDVPREAMQRPDVLLGYVLGKGAEYEISIAARLGDEERVRGLLDEDAALANHQPKYSGYYNGSPLRNAAAAGYERIVQLLLERGADPNQADPVAPRGAALHNALSGRHWGVAKLLLEHGADPNAAVESSGDVMWTAKHKSAPAEVVELLVARGGRMRLEMACYDGDVEFVSAWLHANPDAPVDADALNAAVTESQRDLLETMVALRPGILRHAHIPASNDPSYVEWLISMGADPKRYTWLDVTPLHRAAERGYSDTVRILLQHGAEPEVRDFEYRQTPAEWALREGHPDTAALLS